MSAQTWSQIWSARKIDASHSSVLARLLAADGMDTGFGSVQEDAWRAYVLECASRMDIRPESSVFEVGCGAGAWLYELANLGCSVAGADGSPALIEYARQYLPMGSWQVSDAADIPDSPHYDFVVSSGVFLYFPSFKYAMQVLRQMVAKTKRGVLILDVPDLSKREAAVAERRRIAGEADYDHRYAGLEHLYFEKDWFRSALAGLGVSSCAFEDQTIRGYANSQFRFNVFAWLE